MKRTIIAISALMLVLATLVGCAHPKETAKEATGKKETQKASQKPKLSKYIIEEDGTFRLLLPQNEELSIELDEDEALYVPYVTDELVEGAAKQMELKYLGHKGDPHYYVRISDGFLCLGAELIEYIDDPADYDDGCSGHRHIMFCEPISNRMLGDGEKTNFVSLDRDYKKIQFFPEPTLEFSEGNENFEEALLTDADMLTLRRYYNDGQGWTLDAVVDRVAFHFDGRVRFGTADCTGWMYFGIENDVLYYNGMFTSLSDEVVEIINKYRPNN